MAFFESLLPAVVSAAGSFFGQQSANETNIQMANAQMDFQREMRATQYQTAVEDMRKAGLNPMLAYSQGGAGTPQGASARVENAVAPAINSAVMAARVKAEVEQLEAQADQAKATAENQRSQAAVNAVQVPKIVAETNTTTQSAQQLTTQSALNSVMYNRVLQEIDNLRQHNDMTKAQIENIKAELPNIVAQGGRIKAETSSAESRAALNRINELLQSLGVNRAANESKAQETWWMRNISPFLPDVLKSTSSAGSIRRTFGD